MSFVNLPIQMFTRFIATPMTPTTNNAPLTVKQSITKSTYERDYPFATETEDKLATSNLSTISDISTPFSDMDATDIDIERESLPMTQLLGSLTHIQERVILAQNGYKKIKKLCNTLQGELIEAEPNIKDKYDTVCIKKCDKILLEEHISFADDNDMHFCVDDDIVREKLILKYLTIDNKPSDNYMCRYIDFFESENDYYLVMENVNNYISLKQFVETAHNYIQNGKLATKVYRKIIKYIIWQLITTIFWLHNDMSCCHLKLCIENISLQNADFIQQSNGKMIVNPCITIKISDFSKTEAFKVNNENNNNFYCKKYCELTERGIQYISPELYNEEIYDARAADMWAIGMILYECVTGQPIYNEIKSIEPKRGCGRWAVMNKCIKKYLQQQNLLKNVNIKMLSLINDLLCIDEIQRINAKQALQHEWFKSYFTKYSKQIEKKSIAQKKKKK
eukprot:156340_1